MLFYVLRNDSHTHEDQTKQAVAFFEPKIKDAMLLGDIKGAVASHTDVILFNIDSKADTRSGREAISVFLKVLNEMQGYCPIIRISPIWNAIWTRKADSRPSSRRFTRPVA